MAKMEEKKEKKKDKNFDVPENWLKGIIVADMYAHIFIHTNLSSLSSTYI